MNSEELYRDALEYHARPTPGKIEIRATKAMSSQRDLALAYSPGVAAPCEAIAAQPELAATYTARGNLVAVVTNGSAVLGLGNIGPLAAKPVMEGKAVLFKRFAGVDVFDIEIDESDPDRLIEIIASLEPTFGGFNLEDIKSPECFYIERELRKRVKVPVFHDDQHGTAIITGAAITNALKLVGKTFDQVKLVVSGAGAAALACLNLLEKLGLRRDNIMVCDRHGVVYAGRTVEMDEYKAPYARDTNARTMAEAIRDADVFLGLSAPRVLTGEMVATMAREPIILALANPTPEILPEEALAARPDAILCTGRSDYPNQVNNVLCFPYLFRGALDVGATTINEEMKIACVSALARLAQQEVSDVTLAAYSDSDIAFGRDYLIPKPVDPRLVTILAPAVAEAAMASGVATRPIADLAAYRNELMRYVFHSGLFMRPMFDRAKSDPKRVVYADGEQENILRAVQTVVDEGLARPILVGRPDVIERRLERFGLRLKPGVDIEIVNPLSDDRFQPYSDKLFEIMQRRGVSPHDARNMLRTNTTVIGALLVHQGEADALICGSTGSFGENLRYLLNIVGKREDVESVATLSVLVLRKGTYFICDTWVNQEPSPETLAAMTLLSCEQVRRFGVTPRVALLSHSNFGTSDSESSRRMRAALALIRARAPELEIDGEMQADAALEPAVRALALPNSTLKGGANVLVMPSLDAANIAMKLLATLGEGVAIGPITLGLKCSAHILPPSATVRRIVNMTAVAVVDEQLGVI